MSKINIAGIVNDIRTQTTYITPLVEAVCNSIDAIGNKEGGRIDIIVKREAILPEMDVRGQGDIVSIDVVDNGVGFTAENRESFDTFRSGMKYKQGGKGFGRFMYLKYFNDVTIESRYLDGDQLKSRSFRFGKSNDIIENEKVVSLNDGSLGTGTTLHLIGINKTNNIDKGIEVIARKLLEKLLVFFVDKNNPAPIIRIIEGDGSEEVVLNNYIGEKKDIVFITSSNIELVDQQTGELLEVSVQVYKVYYSNSTSKVSLTANKREVTNTSIHNYIPEFKDTLFEIDSNGKQHNYAVKAYVLGAFLDDNVTVERDGFTIAKNDGEIFSSITEAIIEREACKIVRAVFIDEVYKRFEEKKAKVISYLQKNAPWHQSLMNDIDLESMPIGISDQDLEMRFQKAKFEKEQKVRIEIQDLEKYQAENPEYNDSQAVSELVEKISANSKNDLVHYVCNRKKIIDLFDILRKRKDDGSSTLEKDIHNLIYPKGRNSFDVDFEEHNLWILDERLVFSSFTASDQSNFKNDNEAPDLAIFFDKRTMYRQGDNIITSPVCIVEFKRPKRRYYQAEENPITQACRYARKILAGEYELPDGSEPIKGDSKSTPVYIYVVCDIVPKIEEFADDASLVRSPDGERYFGYMPRYNAYIEVVSYRSLIESAKMRNAVFFKKLGI